MNETMMKGHEGGALHTAPAPTPLEIWGYGLLSVTIINLSSVMGILFFPLMKKSFYTIVMRVMIGLAIGSLSGSAIFHLIPQAFGLGHLPQSNYLFTASFIWFSIWIVMILECTIKIIVKSRAKNRQQRRKLQKEDGTCMTKQSEDQIKIGNVDIKKADSDENTESMSTGSATEPLNPEKQSSLTRQSPKLNVNYFTMDDVHHSTLSLNRVLDAKDIQDLEEDGDKSIKPVAWIVIIGDSLHNFIDGVSIGAGFSQSLQSGLVLSLAVACDEFPHELGDFAILINSGLSVKRAIMFNFISALTCYFGFALGILLGRIEFENFIFAFAAGVFLYVSLVDMIPEVAESTEKASEISSKEAWLVLLNHNVGILVGISILYILAKYSPES